MLTGCMMLRSTCLQNIAGRTCHSMQLAGVLLHGCLSSIVAGKCRALCATG